MTSYEVLLLSYTSDAIFLSPQPQDRQAGRYLSGNCRRDHTLAARRAHVDCL